MLERHNNKTRIYNYFFIILVVINVLIIFILITCILIDVFTDFIFIDEKGNSYILLSHSIFSFSISIILFALGMHIKSMINTSLKDSYNHDDLSYYVDQTLPNMKSSTNFFNVRREEENETNLISSQEQDIYFSVRIKQVNIVIWSFVLCDLYQLLFVLLRMFFLHEHFDSNDYKTYPKTEQAAWMHFLNRISVILPVFTNYIAFYYLIRNDYNLYNKMEIHLKCESICENNLNKYQQNNKKNSDIDQYLISN